LTKERFKHEYLGRILDNVDFFHEQSCVHFIFINSQFYCWRKPEFPEKTTVLPQVTDKHYHIEITLVLLPINNSQATVDEK
jgi:hypothetical protein